MSIVSVIMAGGSGTRLWPLSRAQYPKQFLALTGGRSLLQETLLRAKAVNGATAPIVLGSEAHKFLIAEQMKALGYTRPSIILEPEGRNTAPAAAVASHFAAREFGAESLVLLMPADQTVADTAAFVGSVRIAAEAARLGRIVTFGIRPTEPQTGYGYIRIGAGLESVQGAYAVQQFVEKPSLSVAEGYLRDGRYLWNGGIFLFRADVFLAELKRLESDIHDLAETSLLGAERDLDFLRLEPKSFKSCRKVSIDYAVMEKTDKVATVPLDAGWDDVGSWRFMTQAMPADGHGNHVHGDAVLQDSSDNLVHANKRLVTLLGVDNVVVVETEDAVLVASRDKVQDVGKLVEKLKADKRPEADSLPRVYRPWGYYETISAAHRFQVKRILVKPGHKLSLQLHHHRAEHWVVVSGTALVTCGEKTFLLTEDQSTYIPLGARHRVENPGKVPLEMIEVQSGAYLGEDDIVRFDDVYGRAGT
ncbi:MAG: mannose-1-phosphate guanylyltransferase/mannose-6-phosphate isomerase [Panacagrimonas sp.]